MGLMAREGLYVCLLTDAGQPCGGGQSNSPLHVVVDAEDFVVVLDCVGRVITLLDPDLGFVTDLVPVSGGGGGTQSAAQLGLRDPRRLCLDTSSDNSSRLYVGDGNGSITVLQLK